MIFRNIFVESILRKEIPTQNDIQFLMEPHPSVVYLNGSINQGFD